MTSTQEPHMNDASTENAAGNSAAETSKETKKRDAGAGKGNIEFKDLSGKASDGDTPDMNFILDIPLEITVRLGKTQMLIHDLLKLGQGSIIELPKAAGETLEILANNRLIAKGDVVVVNEKYGIRLTEVISPVERVEKLK